MGDAHDDWKHMKISDGKFSLLYAEGGNNVGDAH